MRRIPRRVETKLRPVRLNLSDLQELYGLLAARTKSVQFEVGEYRSESEADLTQIPEREVNDVYVRTSEPEITLVLSRSSAVLHASDSDPLAMGLLRTLEEFFHSRRRRLLGLVSSPWFPWLALPLNALIFIIYTLPRPTRLLLLSTIAALLCFLGLFIAGAATRFFRYTVITMLPKAQHVGFWARNRDNIAINVLIAILSVVLGYLVASH